MGHPMQDTHPSAEAIQIEILRQMPPSRKIELVFELCDTVSALTLLGIRNRCPGIGERELHRRYADLALGENLAKIVYGQLKKD